MTCKKSELVSAINSFSSARVTGDGNLIAFAGNLVSQFLETIEFAAEENSSSEEESEIKDVEVV